MSYKGIYRPSNPKKYKGDSKNIIYRSLWERKFMNYCDLNENILEWASEEFWIPYLDPTTIVFVDTFLIFSLNIRIKTVIFVDQ